MRTTSNANLFGNSHVNLILFHDPFSQVDEKVVEEIPEYFCPDEEDSDCILKDLLSLEHIKKLKAEKERGISGGKKTPIIDNSASLTRRLVNASKQFEVRQVIGEAFKNISQLRLAVAFADEKDAKIARALIRRLERLIRRGNKKVTDLNREDGMERRKKKAESEQKEKLAKAIEEELRLRVRQRKSRERGYLNGAQKNIISGSLKKGSHKDFFKKLDSGAFSKISAKAMSMSLFGASVKYQMASGGSAVAVGFAPSQSIGAFSAWSAGISGVFSGAATGCIDVTG